VRNAAIRAGGLFLFACLLPACGVTGGGGTLNPTIAPGIPDNVEVRAGSRSATITWTESAAGASYTVLRALSSHGPYFPVSVAGQFRNATTYVDLGLRNGTEYFYQVQATNSLGSSAPSEPVQAIPDFKPVAIAASLDDHHHAAVLRDGSVWDWGSLQSTGGTTNGDIPVAVSGLADITALAIGSSHGLALADDGRVWSWGQNNGGALGTGTTANAYFPPTPIPTLSGITAVAAGQLWSLALDHDGAVWVWGDNNYGQAGDGTSGPTPNPNPVKVPGLQNIIAIACGAAHALALRKDGLVYGWGLDDSGQVGDGTITAGGILRPVLIEGLTGVTALAAGLYHSLALRSDGTVMAWGADTWGQLGTSSSPALSSKTPVKTAGLAGVVSLGAGGFFSLAVKSDGTAVAWGKNKFFALGTGNVFAGAVSTPAPIVNLKGIRVVTGSLESAMALAADGSLWIWGNNREGELGNSTGIIHVIPRQIDNVTGAAGLAAGSSFGLIVRDDGTIWGWGSDESAQLGNGSTIGVTPVLTPLQALGVTKAKSVAAGFSGSIALLTDGTVLGWGANDYGTAGTGTNVPLTVTSPQPCPALSQITAIASGASHRMALKSDGTVWTWGLNYWNLLGYSTPSGYSATPTQVPGISGIVSIAGSGSHCIAAKDDGTVWVWGNGSSGQLGLGAATTSTLTPVQVPTMSGVISVAAGLVHSIALCSDGTVWTWGLNDWGQLGNGGTTDSFVPVHVPGLTQITGVAGGNSHTIALRSDGTVWAWGINGNGELGNPLGIRSEVPVPVLGLDQVTAISAGLYFNLALRSNGTVWAWGSNNQGQLDAAVVDMQPTPVLVAP